jgi:phage gp29-like protein
MAKKKNRKKEVFDPRKDTGINRPITARVAGDINDKFSDYPSNGLTPRRLARIFRAADEGDVRAQMELFEEIEEKDTHLFSQMQTRKLAVTGLDWEVQPFSEALEDKEIADFISGQLSALENFDEVLIDMLDAIGKGVSILEIEWAVKNGRNVIEDIEYVHPKKLIWDSTTDEMMICTKEYPAGIEFPENKFVVHRYKAKSGHISRAGIMRVVAWMYLFKNYDIKDWVSFCEVFGMPLRLGKYDAAASEDDKKQLMEAIISLGTDAAGIVPSSTMIEFIESQKTTSVEIYERLARYCDEQISKAILGQTLTSDSGGGSYAQSKTHNEVRHDLTVADAKALAVTIRRDIIRPLVEFNFGIDANIPLFGFDCREVEDQKEVVEIYKTLVCDMGLEISKSHIYKKFNIPKPEEGDEILNPPHPAEGQELPGENENILKLKQDQGTDEQSQVDEIVAMSNKQAEDLFRGMMQPIFKIIDKSKDMEELQKILKDESQLRELYQEMESPELEDLIQQGIYLSHLIGRSMG